MPTNNPPPLMFSSRAANQQSNPAPMQRTKEPVITGARLACAITANAVLSFCFGAVGGAFGYNAMLNSQNWSVEGFSKADCSKAVGLGAVILSPAALGLALTWAKANEQKLSPALLLVITTAIGALDGMTGAGILQKLNDNQQLGYAAAVGASGNALACLLVIAMGIAITALIYLYAMANGLDFSRASAAAAASRSPRHSLAMT